MKSLTVELADRSYPIRIGAGLLADARQYAEVEGRRLKLVTDSNVAPLYLAHVLKALNLKEEDALVLPAGEEHKSWATVERVLDWMLGARLNRDGMLVALGGGVIGDMAGFAAAIYQRGIDFIQIPTTLLAQVDSSVGGKTGVNHPRGKNMIGAFHQPKLVLADTAALRSLPQRELLAGIAEVIKYGMLADSDFFKWLEQRLDDLLVLDTDALTKAIYRSCELKARIVAQDERESLAGGAGPRALLNLGHTFGHAIETYTGYTQWLHGRRSLRAPRLDERQGCRALHQARCARRPAGETAGRHDAGPVPGADGPRQEGGQRQAAPGADARHRSGRGQR
jgi:3-dehydroquinate synthase